MLDITIEKFALHHAGNTCTALHRKYKLYITQETHALN